MNYRHLTEDEVLRLKSQSCLADDWGKVMVAEDFVTEFVHHTRFSGDVRLGVFQSDKLRILAGFRLCRTENCRKHERSNHFRSGCFIFTSRCTLS